MARFYDTKGYEGDQPFPRDEKMETIPYVKGALADEQYPDNIQAIDAYQSRYAAKVRKNKNTDYPKADKIKRYMPGFGKDL